MAYKYYGEIAPTTFDKECKQNGCRTDFHNGFIYRYPGLVPLLEVSGNHYEMGLQYGVLLKPEIIDGLERFNRIFTWTAARMGMPLEPLIAGLKQQGQNIFNKLPQRFKDELQGVSDGSGVQLEDLTISSLYYDILMSSACTGVLMQGKDNTIIHGRNNDTSGFGGEELANLTVVVKHKAEGYHEVIHTDFPMFMGIETGSSSAGLGFSEETLNVREPNPEGVSMTYLVRQIMEECDNIEQVSAYFDKYSVVGAYGMVWSDRNKGVGRVLEVTPHEWAAIDMQKPILWNFNHLYSEKLKPLQTPSVNLKPDTDREEVAQQYKQKDVYEVDDALDFIGLQQGPDGLDYAHCGMKSPICNMSATQAVVFDPKGDGLYLGTGCYFAARQNIYYISNDFSKKPSLYRKASPLLPVVVESARIENLLVSAEERRDEYVHMLNHFPDDAFAHFKIGYYSYITFSLKEYTEHFFMAEQLSPDVAEYGLFAGVAAYQQGDKEKVVKYLQGINTDTLYPFQMIMYHYLLSRCSTVDSAVHEKALAEMISALDAEKVFAVDIQPKLEGKKE